MASDIANPSSTLDSVVIRKAIPDDAEGTITLLIDIAAEPEIHVTYTVEEADLPVERQREIIESYNLPTHLYLVAEAGGQIVGDLTCCADRYKLTGHVAQLGMGIRKDYRNRGVGTKILQEAIAWAKATGTIKRIELDVVATNQIAIHLYEKFGFEIEGRRRNQVCKDGEYVDQLIMGLLL